MSEYKKYMDLLHGDIASAGLVLRYYNKIFGFTPESEERKKLEEALRISEEKAKFRSS